MTRDFDTLIRDAAPAVPDPGEVRRLNRALLKQRMGRDVVRKARRRRVSVLATGVALLFLGAGNVGELGSDHFDLGKGRVLENVGGTYYQTGVRGQGVFRLDGQTEEEALEIAIQSYLEEGRFVGITGVFMENAYSWYLKFEVKAGDDVVITGRSPEGLPLQMSRELYEFTMAHWDDLLSRIGKIPAPNPRRIGMTIEGQTYQFDYWRLVYPDFGPVEYYVTGSPR
jgi:hypothetical protein